MWIGLGTLSEGIHNSANNHPTWRRSTICLVSFYQSIDNPRGHMINSRAFWSGFFCSYGSWLLQGSDCLAFLGQASLQAGQKVYKLAKHLDLWLQQHGLIERSNATACSCSAMAPISVHVCYTAESINGWMISMFQWCCACKVVWREVGCLNSSISASWPLFWLHYWLELVNSSGSPGRRKGPHSSIGVVICHVQQIEREWKIGK